MKEFMSVPLRQKAYQPFGDLRLHFAGHDKATDYRRELDLDAAVARVRYRVGDTTFERQVFASYPDQVIVVRLTRRQARPGELHGQPWTARTPQAQVQPSRAAINSPCRARSKSRGLEVRGPPAW